VNHLAYCVSLAREIRIREVVLGPVAYDVE
jgi:hypothetical protein